MNTISEVIQDEMPIGRAVATCGVCDEVFFDTDKEADVHPVMFGMVVEIKAETHVDESGHNDLQVTVDKREPLKEIDATITINE